MIEGLVQGIGARLNSATSQSFAGRHFPAVRLPAMLAEPRRIEHPLRAEMLVSLDARTDMVQFADALDESEYIELSRFLSRYPNVTLRAYGELANLDFLQHFPELRRLQVDIYSLENWDGLKHLPSDLEVLGLGTTKKTLSLAVIKRFRSIRRLYLEGHHKDIGVLADMSGLRELTLRSLTLPDLGLLTGLRQLWSLEIKLGGTRDLRLLPRLKSLKYLELWMVRGLEDLSPVGDAVSLQYLSLQALRRVRSIPNLHKMTNLRRVYVETMKGLRDLRPLASAPALEELFVVGMSHLQPADFANFLGLHSLKRVSAGLGSQTKNEAVASLLGSLAYSGQHPRFEFR